MQLTNTLDFASDLLKNRKMWMISYLLRWINNYRVLLLVYLDSTHTLCNGWLGYTVCNEECYWLILRSFKMYLSRQGRNRMSLMHRNTDYGRPVRKSPSLHVRKSTSTPKFFRYILSATSAQIFRFLWFMPSLGVRSPCV